VRTYEQALAYLNSFVNYERQRTVPYSAESLNLDRVRALLERLGNPQHAYPTIHIAGTKGKGSTAAMIESILRAAGYRTGLYTSPHLHTFRERMRVSGESISRESLAALVDEAEPHIASVEGITWFEIVTALGFLHFARSAIDAGVIEVGLGGRFDATNVITPLVAVITSLSMDHVAWLGDRLEQIAFEKAGIVKPGAPVVSAPQKPEALAVLERIAAERRAPLIVVGRDVRVERRVWGLEDPELIVEASSDWMRGFSGPPLLAKTAFHIPLPGAYQVVNAAVAVTALAVVSLSKSEIARRGLPNPRFWPAPGRGIRGPGFGNPGQANSDRLSLDTFLIDTAAVQTGLRNTRWPGRFEIARRKPPLIFDGAHNADSAQKLASTLEECFPGRRWTLIFGSSSDKDIAGMLDALLPLAERAIVTRARSSRAADVESIAQMVANRRHPVEIASSVHDAVQRAITRREPAVVTGSLYIVAEAREAWLAHAGLPLPDRDIL
jgi:dihydrofolate synthase/folylpolyglutamate synthase